jgi:GDP-fucose transporter C1
MSGNADVKYIATVVAVYWFVSISMVYLNKALMSSKEVSIDAPLFVTWFQCVVTALICWGAGEVGTRMQKRSTDFLPVKQSDADDDHKGKSKGSGFFAQFPKAEYNRATAEKIFPLSVVFVGMITFNNLCLKWVEVSFYNVARSLTIVFNVVFSSVMLGSPTSPKTGLCLLVVILGFFMGANGELNFSVKGTVAGIASSLFVSLNSIFTKKVLPAVDNDHWKLTFYNNINAIVLFLPLMAYFEAGIIYEALGHQLTSGLFWSAMCVAGFFGFSIGIVTVLQIKATSPLSHNISGTAKAAVQSMMAFYIWGNQATFLGVTGIFVVLGGSLLYTLVKMRESPPPSRKNAPPASIATSIEKEVQMVKEKD